MVSFSDRNGPAWNHSSEGDIISIFSPHFGIRSMEHFSSIEGDGVIRFFYATLFENRWVSMRTHLTIVGSQPKTGPELHVRITWGPLPLVDGSNYDIGRR